MWNKNDKENLVFIAINRNFASGKRKLYIYIKVCPIYQFEE